MAFLKRFSGCHCSKFWVLWPVPFKNKNIHSQLLRLDILSKHFPHTLEEAYLSVSGYRSFSHAHGLRWVLIAHKNCYQRHQRPKHRFDNSVDHVSRLMFFNTLPPTAFFVPLNWWINAIGRNSIKNQDISVSDFKEVCEKMFSLRSFSLVFQPSL